MAAPQTHQDTSPLAPSSGATRPAAKRWVRGGYIAIVAIALGGVAAPYWIFARRVEAQITLYTARKMRENSLKRHRAQLDAQVKALQKQARKTHQLIPNNFQLGHFLRQLSRCQRAAKFMDATIHSGAVSRLAMCRVLPVSVRGAGTARQFAQFLRNIEALPRKCWVRQLSIQTEPAMTGRIHAQFTVEIYALSRRH